MADINDELMSDEIYEPPTPTRRRHFSVLSGSIQRMALEIQKMEDVKRRKLEKKLSAQTCSEKTHLCCGDHTSSRKAYWWQVFLCVSVVISLLALIGESFAIMPSQDPSYPDKFWFDLVEVILCFIFCGEILVRLYVAPLWCKSPRSNTYRNEHGSYNAKYHPNNKYGQPIHPSASSSSSPSSTATNNREQEEIGHNDLEIPFFKDFMNYMDIISVIPTFIEAADLFEPLPLIPGKMTSSQIVISLLKGTRALRLYKIFRAHPGTKILIQTMHGSSKPILVIFPVMLGFLLVGGPLIMLFEPCLDDDCVFKDSFNAGYFLIITLTTVGYGDQIPTQNAAQIIALVTMIFGSVFFAVPLAIIGNQFQEAYDKWEKMETLQDTSQALHRARSEFQNRLTERRERITKALFSLLYDIQRCEKILELTKDDQVSELTKGKKSDKYLAGPAGKALIELSRKHSFLRLDLGNLYRSHREDHHLPKRVRSLMNKITSTDLDTKIEEEYRKSSLQNIEQIKQGFEKAGKEKAGKEKAGKEKEKETKSKHKTNKYTFNQQSSPPPLSPPLSDGGHHPTTFSFHPTSEIKAHNLSIEERKINRRKSTLRKMRNAKRKNGWKDKIWLHLENHHSSPLAEKIYLGRLVIYLMAALVIMLSTWPEYNAYGESTRTCKRLVVTYCNLIQSSTSTLKKHWIATNPACFPNAKTGYKGCLDEKTCGFPSIEHNMTCNNNNMQTNITRRPFFHGCKLHRKACSSSQDRKNSIISITGIKYWNVNMCDRRACIDNVNIDPWLRGYMLYDGSTMFAVCETIFLIYFWMEYILRFYVTRSFKTFCEREYMSLLFVIILTAEYIMVLLRRGTFSYDPWGIGFLEQATWPFRVDTHSLRVIRLMVPARFVYITSDFKGIRNLKETMWRTMSRLVPFLFFFLICLLQLTFFMFYAEVMKCKPVHVSDGEGGKIWRYMRANGIDDCKIQDIVDAAWLIMVTLTSVGYGGMFPQSAAGKGIAVIASLFGLFAQAMPLTIIGNTFYNIHIEQERKRRKLHGRFKLRKAVFKCTSGNFSKKINMYHCDPDHLVQSGYEELNKSMRMQTEHHDVVDEYIDITRDDIHTMNLADMQKFSALHDQVSKIISLYLHQSDASMVMKKQEELAREMVKNIKGIDPNHKDTKKLVLSTFEHLSTRYIDGESFHEMHQDGE